MVIRIPLRNLHLIITHCYAANGHCDGLGYGLVHRLPAGSNLTIGGQVHHSRHGREDERCKVRVQFL